MVLELSIFSQCFIVKLSANFFFYELITMINSDGSHLRAYSRALPKNIK